MRYLVALFAALMLAGCGTIFSPVGQIPVSQTLSPAAQAAQTAINEGNVLITAAANVLAQNALDGIVTKEEGRSQLARLEALRDDMNRARDLLKAGDVAAAGDKAELARKLIVALHREIADRRRKQ